MNATTEPSAPLPTDPASHADDVPAMRIGSIAPWYGAKRTIAPAIVEELGDHSGYWEPFCGSLAVLFTKPPAAMEVVNDLHGDLINLARVVASDRWEDLFCRLNRELMSDAAFQDAEDALAGPPVVAEAGAVAAEHVARAAAYMAASWMGRNGISGTHNSNRTIATRYTPGGGNGARRWRSAIESMPAWHVRLQNVHIKRMDAFEMIARVQDHPRTAMYLDPPYLAKSDAYVHDFAPADHDRLAELLSRFVAARVVVSYYDHPRLDALYPPDRWTRRPVAAIKNLVQASPNGGRRRTAAPEVLLINGPSRSLATTRAHPPQAPSHAPIAGGLFL